LRTDGYEDDLNWAVEVFSTQRIPAALLVVKGTLS
jgi:hypothetical protein